MAIVDSLAGTAPLPRAVLANNSVTNFSFTKAYTAGDGVQFQVGTDFKTGNAVGLQVDVAGVTTARMTPTIAWTTPVAITHGTALSSSQLNATTIVPGTLSYSPTHGTILNVGTNTLTVVFRATDSNNYVSPVTNTVRLVVVSQSFSNWSSNQTLTPDLFLQYAVGGASAPWQTSEAISQSLFGGTLSLQAVIRTNDPTLTFRGESADDLAGSWSTNLVSVTTNGVSQTNVPSGHERRKYSVDQGTGARRFLRLTIQR